MSGASAPVDWKQLRLAYVARSPVPSDQANSIQAAKMCAAFAACVRTVELVSPMRLSDRRERRAALPQFGERHGVPGTFRVTGLPFPHLGTRLEVRGYALAACSYVLLKRFDVTYTREPWVAYWLARLGHRVGFEAHDLVEDQRYPIWRRLVSDPELSPALFGVFCISRALAQAYVGDGARPDLVRVAPDGVDLERFAQPQSKEKARAALGLPLDRTLIVHVGHMYPGRGIEEAAQAVAQVPNSLLVLVGGRTEDRARVEAWATERGIRDRLLLLGRVANSRVPLHLWAADVLVMPYTSRTPTVQYMSPLKMFEYMAAGRPIVATDFPAVREVLEAEHSAILVKPDDPQALLEGIRRVLGDKAGSQRLGDRARETVVRYSWNRRAEAILSAAEHS